MLKRIMISKLSILLCFVMIIGISFALAQPQVAYAAGTTYYINNLTGSNSNPGTSQASPWYDFTNVNSRTFQPGDQMLLARGCTWNQRMDLYGSGTSADWITVDAYGTGSKPKIQRNSSASDRTIEMHDNSYVSINNLEICNAGMGIHEVYTTKNHQGLHFSNLYLHNIDKIWRSSPDQPDLIDEWNSYGIWIDVTGYIPNPTEFYIKDITIENVETSHTDPFWLAPGGTYSKDPGNAYFPDNTVQDVMIRNCYFHDADGCAGVQASKNVTILDCLFDNMAAVYQAQGNTGLFYWFVDNVAFVNSINKNISNQATSDQSAIDLEWKCKNCKIRGSHFANNAGPANEYLAIWGTDDYSTNSEIKGNSYSNNSWAQRSPFFGAIFSYGAYLSQIPWSGNASDNLYYEPTGFTSGNFSTWTFSNNRNISSAANIYNASDSFSGMQGQGQWSYQYYNGSSWLNMNTYDSANQRWTAGNGYVSRFNLLPDNNTAARVSKTWTAPGTGTISIRGRVLKNDIGGGDGVDVLIAKNDATIWGTHSIAYNDRSGLDSNLDNISVNEGDVIRFEVNYKTDMSNDLTSWSPIVAYTSISGGSNTSYVSSLTTGGQLRNDYGNYVGMKIMVGGYDITVNELGRYFVSGNSGAHTLKIVRVSDGVDMGSVSINMASGTADSLGYKYAALASPITLAANTAYYIVSLETNGGDQWYGNTTLPSLTTTSAAAVNSGVYYYNGWVPYGSAGNCYVPLNFKYSTGSSATKVDDTDAGITYSGTWYTGTPNPAYYNSTIKWSTTAASYAQYTFTGTSVGWYASKGPEQGKADVYIDGVFDSTVDLYSPTVSHNTVVYAKTGLSAASHTVKVVVRNDKNPSSGNYYVTVDAFEYIN